MAPDLTRREFVKLGVTGATALAAGASIGAAPPMPERPLGRTGHQRITVPPPHHGGRGCADDERRPRRNPRTAAPPPRCCLSRPLPGEHGEPLRRGFHLAARVVLKEPRRGFAQRGGKRRPRIRLARRGRRRF